MAPRILAGLIALALVPAGAHASSKPSFPKRVSGTISGSYTASKDGVSHKGSWVVKGVRFKLVHVRFVENTWTGFYDVTGGTVTYTATETGPCTYVFNKTFALAPALPSRRITTPFSMTRNMLGRDSYGGDMAPTKRWNVTETCSYEGSDPTTQTKPVVAGQLFNTGEKRFKIGGSMKGRYSIADDFENEKTVWKWSLKPR